MRLQTRLTLAILLIALLPLGVLSLVLYANYRDDLTAAVLDHLQSTASVQQARVSGILDRNAERLALVASRTQLRLSLQRYLQEPDPADQARMTRILRDAVRSIDGLVAITVYDIGGQPVATTAGEPPGRPPPDPALLARARGGAFVDHIVRSEAGQPHAHLAGPMFLDGAVLGVIVIEARLQTLVAALADSSGLGLTGETVLVRAVAPREYQFLAPTRFFPEATLTTFVLAQPGDEPCDPFLGAVETECVDYRGRAVFAAGRRIPGTDWALAAKMDRGEVLAHLNRTVMLTVLLVLALSALIVVVTLRFARRLSTPLVDLARATDDLARGDYNRRVPVRSHDEVGTLARGFNAMADRVAAAHTGLQEKVDALNAEIRRRRRAESEREHLIAELTQAMTEIKTLEGIIPICASCKKIRDDHGYWNQLEKYLTEHSGARFSHGLCPDCLQRYEEQLEAADQDAEGRGRDQ